MPISTQQKRRRGRPPKDQADFQGTREALLRSGMALLTEKGYSATGIDQILRRVGVPKGSFYHYFRSKDAFVCELIGSYAKYFQRRLDRCLGNDGLGPLDRLRAFVEDGAQGMARYDFKRGCLVGNLGQEMNALPEEFRDQIGAVFSSWERQVRDCLVAAKEAGEIPDTADCDEAAYVFWVGWEGAVLRAKLERGPEALHAFARFFIASLG